MDDETRQALSRLRDRVEETNENLNATTDAVGALIEEISTVRQSVAQNRAASALVLEELRFFRQNLQEQINYLRNSDEN